MSRSGESLSRSLATLGLAVCGPVAFFTGLFTAALTPGGVPGPLLLVFVVSTVATALLVVVYVLAWQREAGSEAGPD